MKFNMILIAILLVSSCKEKKMDQSIAFRLQPGEDLIAGINKVVTENRIRAGWIITTVGSLKEYNIRFANQEKATNGSGYFEIVSLTGTLSVTGNHLHIAISNSSGKTIGGHLLSGNKIYTTAEIVIGVSGKYKFSREQDGSTPWKELQISDQ